MLRICSFVNKHRFLEILAILKENLFPPVQVTQVHLNNCKKNKLIPRFCGIIEKLLKHFHSSLKSNQ